MTTRKVMSREDVFRFIETVGAATLASKPVPELHLEGDFAEPDDVADAMAAFGRKMASHFETLPERISDDPKMQEVIRATLDRTLSECALAIEQAIKDLGAG